MNHLAINLVTKGLLNISNMTKGMVVIGYEIIKKRKSGGGSGAYAGITLPYGKTHYEPTFKDPKDFYKDIKEIDDDVDLIEVYVKWDKQINTKDKKIEVEMIQRKIEAIILQETNKNIKVQIIG